ncbi:hypothetical protein [Nocardia sp. BMG111209]|uniref:hypothetical protein n=1 Tax=Nocardia sp. BMG111209 TaxID=1160137 RepID=UPI001E411AE0|nr:hypothetical protein [Nocardia sp. BMG111209]
MSLSHARKRAAALAVTAAVAMMLTACGGHTPSTPAPASPDLTGAPAGLHWESFQGITIPAGDDGPAAVDTATGYTRTPQGAALAAINHTVRLSVADDGQWAGVTAAEVAAGPRKDAWTLARARISITAPASAALAPRIVGYRITEYRPDRAAVTVYSEYPDRSCASTDTRVVWNGGDWRLELPDPSAATGTVAALSDIPAGIVALAAPR